VLRTKKNKSSSGTNRLLSESRKLVNWSVSLQFNILGILALHSMAIAIDRTDKQKRNHLLLLDDMFYHVLRVL
jgi:hypothetical protein